MARILFTTLLPLQKRFLFANRSQVPEVLLPRKGLIRCIANCDFSFSDIVFGFTVGPTCPFVQTETLYWTAIPVQLLKLYPKRALALSAWPSLATTMTEAVPPNLRVP